MQPTTSHNNHDCVAARRYCSVQISPENDKVYDGFVVPGLI